MVVRSGGIVGGDTTYGIIKGYGGIMNGAAAAIEGGGGIGAEGREELFPASLLLDILPTIY